MGYFTLCSSTCIFFRWVLNTADGTRDASVPKLFSTTCQGPSDHLVVRYWVHDDTLHEAWCAPIKPSASERFFFQRQDHDLLASYSSLRRCSRWSIMLLKCRLHLMTARGLFYINFFLYSFNRFHRWSVIMTASSLDGILARAPMISVHFPLGFAHVPPVSKCLSAGSNDGFFLLFGFPLFAVFVRTANKLKMRFLHRKINLWSLFRKTD